MQVTDDVLLINRKFTWLLMPMNEVHIKIKSVSLKRINDVGSVEVERRDETNCVKKKLQGYLETHHFVGVLVLVVLLRVLCSLQQYSHTI